MATTTLDLPTEFQELLDDFRMVPVRTTASHIQVFHAGPYCLHVAESEELAQSEATRLNWLKGNVPVAEVVWQRGNLVLLTRRTGHPIDSNAISADEAARMLGHALAQWHQVDTSTAPDEMRETPSECLVHGQFSLNAVLWSQDEVASFVDVDRAHCGDPYEDLAAAAVHLHATYQTDVREALFEGYGLSSFDEQRWRSAMAHLPRVAVM